MRERKRNVHKNFYFSEEEAETLAHYAEESRLSESNYVRMLIMKQRPSVISGDIQGILQQLQGVARNINQLTKFSHEYKNVPVDDFNRELEMLHGIIGEIRVALSPKDES